MRADEEFARRSFARYLDSLGLTSDWVPGANPPDYVVELSCRRFNVEVTQVMDSPLSGGVSRSEQGWLAAFRDIVKQLQVEMPRRVRVRGGYAVHLAPVPNLKALVESSLDQVERYIDHTSAAVTAPPQVLWSGARGRRWTIEKVGDRFDFIGGVFTCDAVKWQYQVRQELTSFLQQRATAKIHLTQTLPDVVLLLVDAFLHSDSSDWAHSSQRIDWSPFHTVARVFGASECQILHSRESRWLTAGW